MKISQVTVISDPMTIMSLTNESAHYSCLIQISSHLNLNLGTPQHYMNYVSTVDTYTGLNDTGIW